MQLTKNISASWKVDDSMLTSKYRSTYFISFFLVESMISGNVYLNMLQNISTVGRKQNILQGKMELHLSTTLFVLHAMKNLRSK
jgi:hypothetical protein